MRDSFTADAGRLAGMVGRALGWRPCDFWNATPAELATVLSAGESGADAPLSRTEMNALLERDGDG